MPSLEISKEISFTIDHLDPHGSGVYKFIDEDNINNICFIPKTLPGEKGKAIITKRRKKVYFAELKSLELESSDRRVPSCSHYKDCTGCHYLHTHYTQEILSKTAIFRRLMKNFKLPEASIEFIESDQREGQRNRIQLHYNKKEKKIGLINNLNHKLTEIPNCSRPLHEIQEELKKLYENKNWESLLDRKSPNEGHLELYYQKNKLNLTLNENYSSGGFSQVNNTMNQKILRTILENSSMILKKDDFILDLFGGSGNLTSLLQNETLVVDSYSSNVLKNHQTFFKLNLYNKNALTILEGKINKKVKLLILDPPRSGLKNIEDFLEILSPENIYYMSCDPHTFSRDTSKILQNSFKLEKIFLFDLFPGTFHFECLGLFSKKT